jgi:hypothetical protein
MWFAIIFTKQKMLKGMEKVAVDIPVTTATPAAKPLNIPTPSEPANPILTLSKPPCFLISDFETTFYSDGRQIN